MENKHEKKWKHSCGEKIFSLLLQVKKNEKEKENLLKIILKNLYENFKVSTVLAPSHNRY